MKGTITRCAAEWVESTFGIEKWKEIVAQAGAADSHLLKMPGADVDDADVLKVFASTGKVLAMTPQDVYDGFGAYWCVVYAPKMYSTIVRRFRNSRELLLGLGDVHVKMTAMIPNAKPPQFEYAWANDRTLLVTYKSGRDLIDVYVGLARGVGKYFKEALTVTKEGTSQVRITFPN